MKKGEEHSYKIPISDIYAKEPNLDPSKNMMVLKVQNEIILKGDSHPKHIVDVSTFVSNGNNGEESVDIKDIIFEDEGTYTVLHYIVYDFWNLDEKSSININIAALDGEIVGFAKANIIDITPFSIQCIAKTSETFKPREQHGAWETWDGSVWVFGGKRNVDKEEEILDDIQRFDSKEREWKTIKPSKRTTPAARFGHVQFWYYNFIIIFGGQGENSEVLGDLWVFNIVKEQWKFIMNTNNTHEIGRKGVDGIVPAPRMFSASVMNTDIGTGYVMGGMLDMGTACDLWSLDIDKIILYVEDEEKAPLDNYWKMFDIQQSQEGFFCRSGHSAAMLDPTSFLIHGGIDEDKHYSNERIIFNIPNQNYKIITNVEGEIPGPRLRPGFLSTGNGMIILYGGVSLKGEEYYTDLWHITVDKFQRISYNRIIYPKSNIQFFMNWRQGFTLHYTRKIKDPVLIGGTYGNNQQSKVLITLPENKWRSEDEFKKGECSPCPRGSVLKEDSCKWWGHNQYFETHKDYFESEWLDWQRGLVAGVYSACVPCEGGFIYDLTDHDFCRQWEEDKIWPIGTKYEFPVEGLVDQLNEVKVDNLPDFNDHIVSSDNTGTIVIILSVLWILALSILIALTMWTWKAKALFVFREMDKTFITGGNTKTVLGGIIVWFFIIVCLIITGGFLINYTAFNSQIMISETKNPLINRGMPSSFLFNVTLYTSRFVDSQDPFEINIDSFQKIEENPLPDLWKK